MRVPGAENVCQMVTISNRINDKRVCQADTVTVTHSSCACNCTSVCAISYSL